MTRVTQVTRQKINELNLDEVLFPYISHSYIGGIDLSPFLSRLTFRVSLVSLAGQPVAGHFYPGGRDATTVRQIPRVAINGSSHDLSCVAA
jgi:hypothetical protein